MGSIVKYDNELNLIPLKGITNIEQSVFFALLYKLKNQGTNEVILEFSELKSLIGFQQNSEHIRKSIKNITKKIAQSVVEYTTEETTKFFTLFQVLEIPNKGDYYIRAKISEPFAYMINKLKNNFTAFELLEFSALSSKYTQTLYRLLKQYKNTGYFKIGWERFRNVMDIPDSYKVCDIDKQILKPAMKELGENQSLFNATNPIFKNLTMEKIKGKGRGRPIESLIFRFEAQVTDPKEQIKQDLKDQRKKDQELIQEQEQRYNPVTGTMVTDLDQYIGSYMRFKNKFGEYDRLKIQSYKIVENKLQVTFFNPDDGFTSFLIFKNPEHFRNTYEKLKI